jgi:hypothetical protein
MKSYENTDTLNKVKTESDNYDSDNKNKNFLDYYKTKDNNNLNFIRSY